MANIRIKAIAETAQAEAKLKGLSDTGGKGFDALSVKSLKASLGFGSFMAAAVGAQRAIVAVAEAAGKLGDDALTFETSFTEVTTLLGDKTPFQAFGKSADDVKAQLLDMAGGAGTAEELTKALYQAISAGQEPAAALRFVEESAQLAVGGITSLEKAVNLNAITLNAYRLDAEELTRVQDTWFKTVEMGITTVDELASNLGKVIPTASTLGVEMEEVGAAMAQLTASGLSTEMAATSLSSAMATLAAKGGAFRAIGVDINEVLRERGLKGAMEELEKATGGTIEGLTKMGFGLETHKALLNLMGDSADAFADKITRMGDKAGAAGAAFDKMSQTTAYKLKEVNGEIDEIRKSLGGLVNELRVNVAPSFIAAFKAVDMKDVNTAIKGAASETMRWASYAAMLAKEFPIVSSTLDTLKVTVSALAGHFKDVGESMASALPNFVKAGGATNDLKTNIEDMALVLPETSGGIEQVGVHAAGMLGPFGMMLETFTHATGVAKDLNLSIYEQGTAWQQANPPMKEGVEGVNEAAVAATSLAHSNRDIGLTFTEAANGARNFGQTVTQELSRSLEASSAFLGELENIRKAVFSFQVSSGEGKKLDLDAEDPAVQKILKRVQADGFMTGHVEEFKKAAAAGDLEAMQTLIDALVNQANAIPRATKGGMEFRGKVAGLVQVMSQVMTALQRYADDANTPIDAPDPVVRDRAPRPTPTPAPDSGSGGGGGSRGGGGGSVDTSRMEKLLAQAVKLLDELNRRLLPGVTGIVYDAMSRNEG